MATVVLTYTGQTGPRTPEGKARSSRNAIVHGLSSNRVVLPYEDGHSFQLLGDDLARDFGVKGRHESYLVEQMAESQWRLNRLRKIETSLMNQLLLGAAAGPDPEDQMAKTLIERGGDPLGKIERYAADAERSYYRARRELTAYRKTQNELDLQARQIADHEHMLRRRAEQEERLLGIPNPYKRYPAPDERSDAAKNEIGRSEAPADGEAVTNYEPRATNYGRATEPPIAAAAAAQNELRATSYELRAASEAQAALNDERTTTNDEHAAPPAPDELRATSYAVRASREAPATRSTIEVAIPPKI